MGASTKKHKKSLFIFRRDLRLEDNTGLQAALANSEEVIAAFIFDPRQIKAHAYKSSFGLQFMLESLQDVDQSLKEKGSQLYFFSGKPTEIIAQLAKDESIEAVFLNQDYTPFSIKRDKSIAATCKKLSLAFYAYHDALLHPPSAVHKDDGKPYTVFTPFYRKAIQKPVTKPRKNRNENYFNKRIKIADSAYLKELIDAKYSGLVKGGRSEAKAIAKGLGQFDKYIEQRDIPSIKGTTGLSAHFKFGTLSVREAFYILEKKFGRSAPLIRQLFWRDFLTHIAFHFPHVFKGCFRPMYDKINWENDKRQFKKWCEGRTGFPIVDVGFSKSVLIRNAFI